MVARLSTPREKNPPVTKMDWSEQLNLEGKSLSATLSGRHLVQGGIIYPEARSQFNNVTIQGSTAWICFMCLSFFRQRYEETLRKRSIVQSQLLFAGLELGGAGRPWDPPSESACSADGSARATNRKLSHAASSKLRV